jgi:hypothetical protein
MVQNRFAPRLAPDASALHAFYAPAQTAGSGRFFDQKRRKNFL